MVQGRGAAFDPWQGWMMDWKLYQFHPALSVGVRFPSSSKAPSFLPMISLKQFLDEPVNLQALTMSCLPFSQTPFFPSRFVGLYSLPL